MRNFEQRMEEIQRRSEKIIKQRKKRRLCIAAACVPAVLCVALFLPQLLSGDVMEPDYHNGAVMESHTEMSQTAAYVEVSGNGMRKTLTEPETVDQFLQLMSAVTPEINVLEQPEIRDETENVYKEFFMDDSEDISISSDFSSSSVYTVTVHTASGEIVCYELTGNQLKSCDSQEIRILMDQELQELRNLLGIKQEENK